MLKKKFILIKTKYENKYSIYYDLENNSFVKREESTSKNIYFFAVLFMVLVRGGGDKKIEYPFWLILVVAIMIGTILGIFFYLLDQHIKSKTFKKIDNSYEKTKEYILLGKVLLANQIKGLIAIAVLLVVLMIMLYFNTTTKYFFGVTMFSFVLSYSSNFCAPIEKRKLYQK